MGLLDCELSEEGIFLNGKQDAVDYLMRFNKYCFQSALWVMGAYELMRVIKKKDIRKEVEDVYQQFRRVRIPLTKFEFPTKGPKNKKVPEYPYDYGVARIAIETESGHLGWEVGSGVFISRNQLADSIYNLYPKR